MSNQNKELTYKKILWILDTRKTIKAGTNPNEVYAQMVTNHIHRNFVLKDEVAQSNKDLLDLLEGKVLENQKEWNDVDGFCTNCEAFLEDEEYKCYCDIRTELLMSLLLDIRGKYE